MTYQSLGIQQVGLGPGVCLSESRIRRLYKMLFFYFEFTALVFRSRNKESKITTTTTNNKDLRTLEPKDLGLISSSTTSCLATLRKLLNLSGPQFLHLEKRNDVISTAPNESIQVSGLPGP